jgi:hypothetical protein
MVGLDASILSAARPAAARAASASRAAAFLADLLVRLRLGALAADGAVSAGRTAGSVGAFFSSVEAASVLLVFVFLVRCLRFLLGPVGAPPGGDSAVSCLAKGVFLSEVNG